MYLMGARGQDQLAEIYTVAELGCFPSFKEPFGLVFVECMACKTPVVGANSGGPKDFVTTGSQCSLKSQRCSRTLNTSDELRGSLAVEFVSDRVFCSRMVPFFGLWQQFGFGARALL